MDLNDSLFWLVGFATLLLGLRVLFARPAPRGWLVVLVAILSVLIAGSVWFPSFAGYAAAALWGLLVLLPSIAQKLLFRLIGRHRPRLSMLLARTIALLHPADGWKETPQFTAALLALQSGRTAEAERLLQGLQQFNTPLGRTAIAIQARQSAAWPQFLHWLGTHPRRDQLLTDGSVLDVYLQALGELGHRREMLHEYSWRIGRLTHHQAQARVAALAGDVATVERLIAGPLQNWPRDVNEFWLATARQTAGEFDAAGDEFERLARGSNALIARLAQMRLERPLAPVTDDELDEPARATLHAIARDVSHEAQFAVLSSTPWRRPVVTWLIALLLTINFLREIPGGSMDPENLVEMGAMVIPEVPPYNQWWRPITAAFLHFGPAHYAMNTLALLFLGARLERAWGWWRTLACFAAAVGVSMTVTPMILARDAERLQILAGASGGIMGLLGGLIGYLLVGRLRLHTPLVASQLSMLAFFVVLQTMFDFQHEEVSWQAHLLGLATGVVCGVLTGALFPPRRVAARSVPAPAAGAPGSS